MVDTRTGNNLYDAQYEAQPSQGRMNSNVVYPSANRDDLESADDANQYAANSDARQPGQEAPAYGNQPLAGAQVFRGRGASA